MKSSITVLFENPFWIGLYERVKDNKYEVCKIMFGAEPTDNEVYAFLLKNWHQLQLSPSVKTGRMEEHKINPKRLRREINRQLKNKGMGTKAQQVLQLQHEQNKTERISKSREQREAEKERRFALRHMKKKAKHKGR